MMQVVVHVRWSVSRDWYEIPSFVHYGNLYLGSSRRVYLSIRNFFVYIRNFCSTESFGNQELTQRNFWKITKKHGKNKQNQVNRQKSMQISGSMRCWHKAGTCDLFVFMLSIISKSFSFRNRLYAFELHAISEKMHQTAIHLFQATSMLLTDVDDKMCWRQVWDVADVLAVFVTDILYLWTLAGFAFEYLNDDTNSVANTRKLSLT